ncbi:pleckstrin homology domain-containing family b member 2-like [Plakobranchus ocellatus]|uniref:Pleckstrin homology domain-containing family b member 2-like n=1 Tax=Plakobranchus ocellatus TaxID=259542 RepID=A0AAV3ZES7_9GAST|nr:pleckstrin homology domain-containing family b member 2-like [Plakobranchus ocellatus]
MADIVKSGYIKRFSKSFLNGGWNKSFLELHRDSTLCVYKKQGDSNCQGSIFMKDVCKCFAYGEYTSGMPGRPEPPSGTSYDRIMGIPQKAHKNAKIHWFLFSSTDELHSWMKAICSVLPPPPQSQHSQQQQQQQQHHMPPQAPPYNHPPAPGYATAPPPAGYASPPTGGYTGPPPPPSGYPAPPLPAGPGPSFGFENLTMGGPPAPGPYPPAAQGPPAPYGPPPGVAHYPPAQPYSMPGPAPVGYPQQQYQYYAQPGYASYPQQAYGYQYQQQPQVVYTQGKPKKMKGGSILSSNTGQMAAGLAGGALLGYGASRMIGGGWGLGRWGSWSSIGSFGSCGSFGSFGSFGSCGSFG